MQNLDSLKCFLCSNQLLEFVVLACGHAICGECFTSVSDSQAHCLAIQCSCGVTTNISQQKRKSRQSSLLKPCSSLPNYKKNKSQILDQSAFTIFETRQSGSLPKSSKITSQNPKRQHSYHNLSNYLIAELSNEIKFMELRFKRYLNQINRSFTKLVSDLTHNYEKILQDMTTQCHFKIEMSQITCISSIQKIIQRAFKPGLQKKLRQISKTLSKFVSSKIGSQLGQSNEKENRFRQNSNVKESFSKNKRHSTHQICKIDNIHQPFQLKKGIKDSKIKKKQTRKLNRAKFQNN